MMMMMTLSEIRDDRCPPLWSRNDADYKTTHFEYFVIADVWFHANILLSCLYINIFIPKMA